MFQSIRSRLVGTYFLLALLTVGLVETLFLVGVRQYYLANIREILEQQAKLAGSFYEQYLGQEQIERSASALLEGFAGITAARMQVITPEGTVLADSLGDLSPLVMPDDHWRRAVAGEVAAWQGKLEKEPVLVVSAPLKTNGAVVGVVRYMTSLEPLEEMIRGLLFRLLLAGTAIVLLAALAGLLLANTIARPVEVITRAAARIAGGDLNVRIPKRYNDEVGRLADTLNHMASELGRLDRLKNEFVSSISHELRTPLTSIKGWVVTLLQGPPSPGEWRQGLRIIDQETDRLTEMVEELLDFSRLQAGSITLRRKETELAGLLENVVSQMLPRARRLGLKLTLKPVAGLTVFADPDRLKQVLINLLDNSFKFTPAGGKVEVRTTAGKGQVTIAVADEGCGIPPDELPLVGIRFFQGRAAKSGSGIGLALCREIVQLHEGHLKIESSPGVGTTVYVSLPLEKPHITG
ncbi:HAMP domain-containing protein [Desulfofundulus sp. TPOSR]|uniref:sensor histidine kinase n=1 Tax=Desulfofundulus sp. TPOSR TaxID=2714340 RepID=UPI00140ABC45|nr:ATP-binding protein [Desulfofundulus sp. TPOSR]NHM27173.1 HAMP domain-containing protein [Desulfofundulus sp. TPOSR]